MDSHKQVTHNSPWSNICFHIFVEQASIRFCIYVFAFSFSVFFLTTLRSADQIMTAIIPFPLPFCLQSIMFVSSLLEASHITFTTTYLKTWNAERGRKVREYPGTHFGFVTHSNGRMSHVIIIF
jgi:hypothetical protein